jgi:tRNA (guanine10-N2)-dimethyltransferase
MDQQIIFELSKEYPLLAKDEIFSCLRSLGQKFQLITSNENVIVIRSDMTDSLINHLSKRLSMSFSIGRLLFLSSPIIDMIKRKAQDHPLWFDGSLAVRYKNRSSSIQSKPIVHGLADIYTTERKVDLTNPDHIVFVVITDENVFVSVQISQINRSDFEKRKAHLRPFFSPISLHPKIARALVNISLAKKGDTLLDPFCGTGGILIEAGLMDINVIGNDISENMVSGAQKNLQRYGINPTEMMVGDVEMIPGQINGFVDVVVSDLPYGKATSTKGEAVHELHARSICCIEKMLKPGGRAVIGTASEHVNGYSSQKMNHIISYPIRVHRSLTRWFHVFERRP